MTNNMEQKREIWLDVARAFACACVIMVHSPAKYDGLIPGQYALAPLNYISMAWGVGLFFALSGALLVGLLFLCGRKNAIKITL